MVPHRRLAQILLGAWEPGRQLAEAVGRISIAIGRAATQAGFEFGQPGRASGPAEQRQCRL
jgi:hypothetical protein